MAGSTAIAPPETEDAPAAPSGKWERVVLAVGLAWLVFTVVQTFLSGRWWFMLAPDLMPPLVFLLLPWLPAAGLLVRRRASRRVAATTLGAGFLSFALGLPWSGLNVHALEGRPAVPPGALRIMSWNTESWGKFTSPERFYGYLRAQRADVYLLQEVVRTDADDANPQAISAADTARIYTEFPGWHIVVRGELVTISRFPIVGRPAVGPDRALANRPDPGWPALYLACKVLRTDVLVGGRVLSLYNVHMPVQVDMRQNPLTPAFYATFRSRSPARQAQFRGLLADLKADPHPALVAGDFNTSPAMGDIKRLTGRLNDASHRSRSLYPVSWNELGSLRLWRLDWAFTTRAVNVERYALTPAPRGFSDHRAQLIRASLRS